MKWINSFYIALLVITSFGCAVSVRESESRYNESDFPSEKETELLSNFESIIPDSSSLAAFDHRALEKVEEFFDLSAIVSDTTVSDKMRKQAAKFSLELFEENNGFVIINGKKIEASDFVDQLFNSELTFQKPNKYTLTSSYSSSFQQGKFTNQISLTYGNASTKGKSLTILIKVEKLFGEEERTIWEIYLQEIYI